MSGCRFGRLRISIHAPQWGATATPSPSLSSFVISIHAPQWGATVPYGCVFGVVVISIHAPQWGATRAALEPWARVANFNPRTPVGCDRCQQRRCVGYGISIHAPQWGATVDIDVLLLDHLISIHAPQWGATEAAEAFLFMPEIFQSTHPSGVRLNYPGSANGNVVISIHAPQWGATAISATGKDARGDFNPRTPVGCDKPPTRQEDGAEISIHAPQWGATGRSGQAYDGELISIHAPQWGATPRATPRQWSTPDFNPRTPVGCDPPKWGQGRATCRISIHAPQWGATRVSGRVRRTAYFNPRTPVGCDRATHGSKTSDKISIHAPQWGATAKQISESYGQFIFQSTHPSGVRLLMREWIEPPDVISIHAPQWGATLAATVAASPSPFQSTHPSGVRR